MATPREQTTLLAALACLDIDLERELQQLRQERGNWEPEWWRSLLGPTPPPASAWTFPAAANAPPVATDTAASDKSDGEMTAPLAIPEPPPTTALAVAELSGGGADRHEPGEDTAPPPLRPSWSERLNRVFARRQAAAGALAMSEEPVGDPWAETFAAPPRPASFRLSQPVLGFALGVTAATLGTWAILGLRQPPRPTPTTPPLRVPAPPPERAVLPTPSPSPVPNLARRELPDLSAIPTASPQTSPTPSPNPGFYYVVTDYHNEQSLLTAQKVVPEAFVWQFPHGVKVQLAAFELREQAEQFVANLKAKGINARVYP